ncbi:MULTISPECIES: response regulator [Trichocoleus]|uniref:Response regulator n=1 Tax=Trichocoleus desertorum GB2-A4 TaxID=2933944 RepID=A0ABV0JCC6_9CYAN|nr:response regulator [Trichocoleus sp. FACHB-46]MBD1864095.1 response regulator [Trichocoleus sp. FACHB-46]
MSEAPSTLELLNDLSILVVEDDSDTAELFSLLLSQARTQVRVAGTVREALEVLQSFEPDILITDIQLPDGDGYDLLKQIRSLQKNSRKILPAIAMTGYSTKLSERAYNEGALVSGFQKYMVKPLDIYELLNAIAELTR